MNLSKAPERPYLFLGRSAEIGWGLVLSRKLSTIRGKALICRQCPWVFAFLLFAPSAVTALPLTSFRYETQAREHCLEDTVVWLDYRDEVYYLKRQKKYGRGMTGSFGCEKEARGSGFRRSLLGRR
jgi:hypothetical protein